MLPYRIGRADRVAYEELSAVVHTDIAVFEQAVAANRAGQHADVVDVFALDLRALPAPFDMRRDEEAIRKGTPAQCTLALAEFSESSPERLLFATEGRLTSPVRGSVGQY